MPEYQEQAKMQKMIEEVMASEQIINIYGNAFICFNTNADMGIIIQKNNKAIAIINLSYSTAKTLGEKLTNMVRDFEKTTDHTIMTINIIDEKLKKLVKKEVV